MLSLSKKQPTSKKTWASIVMKFSWSYFNLESQNYKGVCPNSHIFMYTPVFALTFPPQYYRGLPAMFGQENSFKQNHIEDEPLYDRFYSDFLLTITVI